jgi:hypothetical protein
MTRHADKPAQSRDERAFRQVVDYFLGHEKPKTTPKKRSTKHRKKPLAKAKKQA